MKPSVIPQIEKNSEIEMESILAEDSHVLHLWEPLKFSMDENFEFVHHGFLFSLFSNLLYAIAYPILFVLLKIGFGFKVEGIENYQSVHGGKITVSNHVHVLDCAMVGISTFPKKTFFTSLASNFKIPFVHTLITLLNAIPIPTDTSTKKHFIDSLNHLLQQGKSIHFYPEGSLWPYYDGIRNFKEGAFSLAVTNQVPIIPFVFKFYKPTSGFYKWLKRKPCVRLCILEPVYPSQDVLLTKGEKVQKLKKEVSLKMESHIKKSAKQC